MSKAKYSGPHSEVWGEGYMQGVEDGQAMAKREAGSASSVALAQVVSQVVAQSVAASSAQQVEMDRAFGIAQRGTAIGSTVTGAVQTFGVPVPVDSLPPQPSGLTQAQLNRALAGAHSK